MTDKRISPEDEQLLTQMAEEVSSLGPMHLAISPIESIRLAGLLQLAGRHEGTASEDHRFAISWFLAHVRRHFEACPATLEVLRRGDDRRYDRHEQASGS
jgi:hypothetical protein